MALPRTKINNEPQLAIKVRESSYKHRLLPFNKMVMKKRGKIEKARASAFTLPNFPLKRKSQSSVSPPFLPYYSIHKLDAFNCHSLMPTNQSYVDDILTFFPFKLFINQQKGSLSSARFLQPVSQKLVLILLMGAYTMI